MKKIKIKKIIPIIVMIVVFAAPSFALGAKWERKVADPKKLDISGACEKKDGIVTVYLIDKISGEQIYSGGVQCEKGEFVFKDDLSKWNISKGSYNLVVGDGQKKRDIDHIEELEVKDEPIPSPVVVASVSNSGPTTENVFGEAMGRFADGLQSLSESLNQMKASLEQTNLNVTVKTVISGTLAVLEKIVSETGLLLASLQEQFQKFDQGSLRSAGSAETPLIIETSPSSTPTISGSSPSLTPEAIPELTPTPTPLPSSTSLLSATPSSTPESSSVPNLTSTPEITPIETPIPEAMSTPIIESTPTPTVSQEVPVGNL